MKYILMLIVFACLPTISFSQLTMKVSELRISNVKEKHSNANSFDEDAGQGPMIVVSGFFQNSDDHELTLHPSKGSFVVMFRSNGHDYVQRLFPLSFLERSVAKLLPGENLSFSTSVRIFLGTDLLVNDRKDYERDLLLTLPTLRLMYYEKSNRDSADVEIVADQVLSVSIKE